MFIWECRGQVCQVGASSNMVSTSKGKCFANDRSKDLTLWVFSFVVCGVFLRSININLCSLFLLAFLICWALFFCSCSWYAQPINIKQLRHYVCMVFLIDLSCLFIAQAFKSKTPFIHNKLLLFLYNQRTVFT